MITISFRVDGYFYVAYSCLSIQKYTLRRLEMRTKLKGIFLTSLLASSSFLAQSEEVSVVHFWVTGSESKALEVIINNVKEQGYDWKDISGNNRSTAMSLYNNMRAADQAVDAVIWQPGPGLFEMVDANQVRNLDDIAKAEKWDNVFYSSVQELSKYKGSYYSIPTNIHGANWMFYSMDVLSESGVEVPTTWSEFLEAAPKIKAAGFTPLALGGEAWQERILFMSIALGEGGKTWFEDVFLKGNIEKLDSLTGKRVITMFRELNKFVDAGSPGRNWNDTTGLLIQDKAAFQFMGDWAKGEFAASDQKIGSDYGCRVAPGYEALMVQVDNFIAPSSGNIDAQNAFIKAATSAKSQEEFSVHKGSLPIRKDADVSHLDECVSYAFDLLGDSNKQSLNPTQVMSPDAMGGLMDAITNFWNNKNISNEDGIASIIDAVEMAK